VKFKSPINQIMGAAFSHNKGLKGLSEPQKEKIVTVLTIQNFFANATMFKKAT
jgi:hypothetical protein